MNEPTKDRILTEALTLFAEKGYEGVSMREIAAKVGIKAASLYNHYASKEDLFNQIIAEMDRRYSAFVTENQIPMGNTELVADQYMQLDLTFLIEQSTRVFRFFLEDPFASKYRWLLVMEQFRNPQAGALFDQFLLREPLQYQTALFSHMIQLHGFRQVDPAVMALHFYAPIFLLLSKYDHQPENFAAAEKELEAHVRQFSAIYRELS